tara:strand:- start:127 stop:318 length:192 start_codon:yes stop_codon:yes gene_type:complete
MSNEQQKIEIFDRYILRGGNMSLGHIHRLVDETMELVSLSADREVYNEICIDVIRKLTLDIVR